MKHEKSFDTEASMAPSEALDITPEAIDATPQTEKDREELLNNGPRLAERLSQETEYDESQRRSWGGQRDVFIAGSRTEDLTVSTPIKPSRTEDVLDHRGATFTYEERKPSSTSTGARHQDVLLVQGNSSGLTVDRELATGRGVVPKNSKQLTNPGLVKRVEDAIAARASKIELDN